MVTTFKKTWCFTNKEALELVLIYFVIRKNDNEGTGKK